MRYSAAILALLLWITGGVTGGYLVTEKHDHGDSSAPECCGQGKKGD